MAVEEGKVAGFGYPILPVAITLFAYAVVRESFGYIRIEVFDEGVASVVIADIEIKGVSLTVGSYPYLSLKGASFARIVGSTVPAYRKYIVLFELVPSSDS